MRRSTAFPSALALSVLLVACGGGEGDAGSEAEDALQEFEDQLADLSVPDLSLPADPGDADAGETLEVEPPTFILTGAVDAPEGWIEDPPNCADPEELGPPFFSYHVPGDWVQRGAGYGGSGGVGGSGDHRYETADGGSVEIEIDEDAYFQGQPTNANGDGEPWETWDYETTLYTDSGEETSLITYEALDAVDVDGETVDLWYLDQAQDELVSQSEFKARLVFGEVPTGGIGDQRRRPASATVTITWDAETTDLEEDDVRVILETARLHECAQEGLFEYYETIHGVDWPD